MIEPSTEIAFRTDFSLLCNARGLTQAVEVGTDMGVFAADFMSRWEGKQLFCVDPYQPYEEMQHDRTADMMMAVVAVMPYHGRVKFLRSKSPEAVALIPDWFKTEFVYIDGSHLYENVKTDIKAWWEKLEPYGILAGHDFDSVHPGVMKAVTEFSAETGVVVRLTNESTSSWYIYKTEPPYLVERFFKLSDRSTQNPHFLKTGITK